MAFHRDRQVVAIFQGSGQLVKNLSGLQRDIGAAGTELDFPAFDNLVDLGLACGDLLVVGGSDRLGALFVRRRFRRRFRRLLASPAGAGNAGNGHDGAQRLFLVGLGQVTRQKRLARKRSVTQADGCGIKTACRQFGPGLLLQTGNEAFACRDMADQCQNDCRRHTGQYLASDFHPLLSVPFAAYGQLSKRSAKMTDYVA